MNKQENNIKNAFTKTPDVLENIKQNPRFKIPEREKHSIFSFLNQHRFKLSFASLVIVALLIISGTNTVENQVYASTVTIDINPSIQITLDEDDLVINVRALNDDGETLIDQDINYRKMTVEQVVNVLISKAVERGFIDVDELENIVLISVDGKTEEVKLRVQAIVMAQIQNEMEKYTQRYQILKSENSNLTPEQLTELKDRARELNISVSKLLYIREIKVLDTEDEYTVLELANMTVRELYFVQQELLDEDQSNQNQNGNQN